MGERKRGGDYEVGYGKPPVKNQFQKERSGNPGGRPRGSKWQPPHENILGRMVTVRENGVARRLRADQAFVQHMVRQGMKRHSVAARDTLAAIKRARERRNMSEIRIRRVIQVSFVAPGSVSFVAETLRLGKILDRRSEADARLKLQPWIVEAALARFGSRRLSVEEQRTIFEATLSPEKVRWPSWWRVKRP